MRQALYFLATRIIRLVPKYRNKYDELVKRGKKKKVALVAIARKLAELVYILLTRNEVFDFSKTF